MDDNNEMLQETEDEVSARKILSFKNKRTVIVTAMILLAAIITGAVLLILFSCNKDTRFDYRKENLYSYVLPNVSSLSGMTVSIVPKKTVSDEEVTESIDKLLAEEAVQKTYPDTVPTAEDRVSFLYRVELDGVDVHRVSNYYGASAWIFSLVTPEPSEDGSAVEPPYYAALRAALLAGLTEAGKKPTDYKLVETKTGTVGFGNAVYVNMSITDTVTGETVTKETARRIDLGNSNDPYFHLASWLATLEIGKKSTTELYDAATDKTLKYEFEPLFVVTEELAIECDAVMPEDFGEGTELAYLGGKTVHFYMVPQAVVRTETPELTDEFVEEISSGIYKGEGAVEKFLADWKVYMQSMEDTAYTERLYAALEEKLMETVTVLSYPEKALEASRRELDGLFLESYTAYVSQNGTSQFPTIESYINKSFDVTTDAAREELIAEIVLDTTKSYLVYYAVADMLGVRPTDSEIATAYQNTVGDMTTSTLAAYSTFYGESYLFDQICYQMTREGVLEEVSKTAVIIPSTENSGV